MNIEIITLFPGMFKGVFDESIVKIAQKRKIVTITLHNLRDFSSGPRGKVDDRPFGGGAGMVLKPEPVFRAVEELVSRFPNKRAKKILLTPQGSLFTQEMAFELSREDVLILLCGRYEGFDERIRLGLDFQEISVGNYVLSGGELPAMMIVDSVVRLLPGVLGDSASAVSDSFSLHGMKYPQYTRPRSFRGMEVPEVLLSGNHEEIRHWRERVSKERTRKWKKGLFEKEQ